jgi:predicted AAA+ superfamily ATPase
MELKRKIYDRLINWKNTASGKTALLIIGARRVGKSYIIERFAENEYQSHIIIDFSIASKDVLEIFETDRMDLNMFFTKLSLIYKTKLYDRNSLIAFDEVQLFPAARQFIKHLVADGRYDYIETGSLLTIKTNIQEILIPSEEEEISMQPLDFEEFLWAKGDTTSVDLARQLFEQKKPVGQAMHRVFMREFRSYMLVGGMPQAVLEYVSSGDFEAVDRIKRNILRLYRNDVAKFGKTYKSKIISIFEEVPEQLTKKEKKFSLAAISSNARYREYEDAFLWLSDAGIINPCFNSTDPGIGLKMNSERNTLKCYMADTGLLVSQALGENEFTGNEIYKSILLGKLGINEGMFAENIVAQMLVATGKSLFFYSKNDREDSSNTMEIDFLISRDRKISPVEVKSSVYKGHHSLDKFKEKFSGRIGTQYVLHTSDLKIEGDVHYLPLYMSMFL